MRKVFLLVCCCSLSSLACSWASGIKMTFELSVDKAACSASALTLLHGKTSKTRLQARASRGCRSGLRGVWSSRSILDVCKNTFEPHNGLGHRLDAQTCQGHHSILATASCLTKAAPFGHPRAAAPSSASKVEGCVRLVGGCRGHRPCPSPSTHRPRFQTSPCSQSGFHHEQ